jgi:hypothetical protein
MKKTRVLGMMCVLGGVLAFFVVDSRGHQSKGESPTDSIPSGIAWYGVLDDGIADAKATNRPILLLSAAPQCAGVPGMW